MDRGELERGDALAWQRRPRARESGHSRRRRVATVILRLDPAKLGDPDLDIRYVLPELIVERSGGRLTDEGYDYADDGGGGATPCLLLFLGAADADAALPGVLEILKSERVLENDLSDVAVAVEDGDEFRVVHPPGFDGEFRPRSKE